MAGETLLSSLNVVPPLRAARVVKPVPKPGACVNRRRTAAGLCWEPHDSRVRGGAAPTPDVSARRAVQSVRAGGERLPPQPEGLGVRTAHPGTKSRAPVPKHGNLITAGRPR